MAQSDTHKFLSYWRSIKPSSESAPLRSDFDPSNLRHLVPQMLMISTSKYQYRFRLSGEYLIKIHGVELKNTSFLSLFATHQLSILRTNIILSARLQKALKLHVNATTSQNETFNFEIILAPLINQEGTVDRLVGLCHPQAPMPLALKQRINRFNILDLKLIDHEDLPRQDAGRPPRLRLVTIDGRLIA